MEEESTKDHCEILQALQDVNSSSQDLKTGARKNSSDTKLASLNLMILNTILMGGTGNFFWYPIFFRNYGIVFGFVAIVVAVCLSYSTSLFVYRASEYTGINDYLNLTHNLLGNVGKNVARFSYFLDYFGAYICCFLLSWNICAFLLYFWGFIDESAILNKQELTFRNYNSQILLYRFLVIAISFLALLPLFLQKRMKNFKYVFIGFMITSSSCVFYLFVDLQEFKTFYQQNKTWSVTPLKSLSLDSFRFALILLCSFYIQSNLLTMKNDTIRPTYARMKKSLTVSHVFFLLFTSIFGFYCYYCLGDANTPEFFLLRQPFAGKRHEFVYQIILSAFVTFIVLYTAFFKLSFTNFLKANFTKSSNEALISLGPLVCAAIIAFIYPKIINFLGYQAIFVCMINGFIFPTIMMMIIWKNEKRSVFGLCLLGAKLAFYFAITSVSLYALILNDLK